MIEHWPWLLTPLTAQTLGGWFAPPGVTALMMGLDGRWSAIRITLESQLIGLALILLATARAWEDVDTSNALAYVFVAGIAALFAGLLALEASMLRQAAVSPVRWDDEVDAVFAGDLTAALGYRTPAGGIVVQAVAPIGMRDRDTGTIGFTTSLGFSKKLERIARDPRVAMAFHAREHGTSRSDVYVLVQGTARVIEQPTAQQRQRVRELSTVQLGPPAEGPFWNRWLREYYRARVPVEITVERIAIWPDLRCAGERRVIGEPWPQTTPDSQTPPKNGTGARVDVKRAQRRLAKTDAPLAGFAGADGRPVVVPVTISAARRPARAHQPCAAVRCPPRRPARAPLPAVADRARDPPAHGLAGRNALRAPHRDGLPSAREQDAPAAPQRPTRQTRRPERRPEVPQE